MILIGSLAYRYALHGDTLGFDHSDIDVVCDFKEWSYYFKIHRGAIEKAVTKNNKLQVIRKCLPKLEVAVTGVNASDQWLLDHQDEFEYQYIYEMGHYAFVPPIELLYVMKMAHVHCDTVHFDKTMRDYHDMKQYIGEIPNHYWDFFKMRKKEAEDRLKHRTPSLNMSNEKFFDRSKDIVGYVFEHDSIHEAVKHYDVPVYEMMKKDFSKAMCDKDMFEELEYIKRIRCVQEEAYVIAIERYLLLDDSGEMTPYLAYKNALKRICTTLCGGFFRKFAIENYYEILKEYDPQYIRKFERGFNKRVVYPMTHVDKDRVSVVMETYIENTN